MEPLIGILLFIGALVLIVLPLKLAAAALGARRWAPGAPASSGASWR